MTLETLVTHQVLNLDRPVDQYISLHCSAEKWNWLPPLITGLIFLCMILWHEKVCCVFIVGFSGSLRAALPSKLFPHSRCNLYQSSCHISWSCLGSVPTRQTAVTLKSAGVSQPSVELACEMLRAIWWSSHWFLSFTGFILYLSFP